VEISLARSLARSRAGPAQVPRRSQPRRAPAFGGGARKSPACRRARTLDAAAAAR